MSFPVGPVDPAGGSPRRECPRDDQDIRWLAGVAKPASVTVSGDSLRSPCVGGTLSSSDIAGRLLPVVLAGMSFPVGPVDPAGPAGRMLQRALLALMGRCPRFSLTRLAVLVVKLAPVGRCPRLNMILLAPMACMFQMARWARCPRLTLVGFSLCLTLHLGVRYLQM